MSFDRGNVFLDIECLYNGRKKKYFARLTTFHIKLLAYFTQ